MRHCVHASTPPSAGTACQVGIQVKARNFSLLLVLGFFKITNNVMTLKRIVGSSKVCVIYELILSAKFALLLKTN